MSERHRGIDDNTELKEERISAINFAQCDYLEGVVDFGSEDTMNIISNTKGLIIYNEIINCI